MYPDEWSDSEDESPWLPYTSGVVAAVGAAVFLYRLVSSARRRALEDRWNSQPKDVVTLHMVDRSPTSPNPSPFPIKVETYLRAMEIKYEVDVDAPFSSKGKTPWITLDGVHVADSQLSVEYLTEKLAKDMDSHLTKEERAIARAFRLMLEDHFYWVLVLDRWVYTDCDDIVKILPSRFFPPFVPKFMRKHALKVMFLQMLLNQAAGQGMGRHNKDEVLEMGRKDLKAISDYLGSKPFLFGDSPCLTDTVLFSFINCFLSLPKDSRSEIKKYVENEVPNLLEHFQQMRDKYWSDYETCRLK